MHQLMGYPISWDGSSHGISHQLLLINSRECPSTPVAADEGSQGNAHQLIQLLLRDPPSTHGAADGPAHGIAHHDSGLIPWDAPSAIPLADGVSHELANQLMGNPLGSLYSPDGLSHEPAHPAHSPYRPDPIQPIQGFPMPPLGLAHMSWPQGWPYSPSGEPCLRVIMAK